MPLFILFLHYNSCNSGHDNLRHLAAKSWHFELFFCILRESGELGVALVADTSIINKLLAHINPVHRADKPQNAALKTKFTNNY